MLGMPNDYESFDGRGSIGDTLFVLLLFWLVARFVLPYAVLLYIVLRGKLTRTEEEATEFLLAHPYASAYGLSMATLVVFALI